MESKLIPLVVRILLRENMIAMLDKMVIAGPYSMRIVEMATEARISTGLLSKDCQVLVNAGILLRRQDFPDKREIRYAVNTELYQKIKLSILAMKDA